MDDLLKLTTAQEIEIAVRLLLAAIFGLAVGYERRSADKPAGLRTLSLVCLGSAIFTIISAFGFETADQSRVAAQIVTGVGFLGAGTILRSGVTISGLTTAATIWATAAIGMAVGSGLYIVSVSGTVLVLVILYVFAPARRKEE
ncbi:MAG TPA: MgtC/SapB family protein [Dehalococcoidia bacterium]|nr:MgtC/SapB family protein [Chloroflexota bacterium]HIB11965.1 MgtC/SapB family protein [Dehalococcoidia bacterium]HIM47288.1 MgtC/SapB family protein [Dehalococcoidia bacterium]